MSAIDGYLKNIPQEKRIHLERIRRIALKIVPNATEVISYGMPTLKYNNQSFLGFNAHANHIGIYPYGGEEIEVFIERIIREGYGFSKGAIRVPYGKPMSEGLLKDIIFYRVKRIVSSTLQ